MKVTDLKENEVIHCETLEQYEAICQLLHEAGLRWYDGQTYLECSVYDEERGSIVIAPKTGEFDYLFLDKSEGCIIHPATDFITPPQTKEEYAKERAIGFVSWVILSGWVMLPNSDNCWRNSITLKINTTAELYDEYLKSLLQTQD